jgi:hypothetical protein
VKYRIYIDEAGNPDLSASDNPNHRFLSLTGIIIQLDHVEKVVHPQLEELKASFFRHHPDDPVILHRKEMINRKPPFQALEQEDVRVQFDERLLNLLTTWDYTVISVCLDKKFHKETYQVWRWDPYHYCLTVLLERFVFFLDGVQSVGDVLAESRGGKEDIRLKNSYEGLWNKGTEYVYPQHFQSRLTSKQLKVKPKINNIAGLQIADMIVHSSRDEILKDNGFWGKDLAPFTQRIVTILQSKYYQKDGKMFGKKFIGGK